MSQSRKSPYIVAFVLFLAGLGYLLYSGLSENSVYFVNVSEALAMEPGQLHQARLFGTVADHDIQQKQTTGGRPGVTFVLLDKDDTAWSLPVDYTGAVPDTFKPGVEVIVEGGLNSASGVFEASTLMTKCPSKYKKIREEELAAREG